MKNSRGVQNHIVVLAKNKRGWENIIKMNYIAYEQGSRNLFSRRVGRIQISVLEQFSEDLVISSACLAGIPSWAIKTQNYDIAEDHVKKMKKLFPESYYLEVQGVDFYRQLDASAFTPEIDKQWIEMQATDQKNANDRIIDLANKLDVPLVLTTDAHYVLPEDRESHLLMLAIQSRASINAPALGSKDRGSRLAFEATPMLSTSQLIEMVTETESGFNGYSEDQVKQWIANTSRASNQCEEPSYLNPLDQDGNLKYKIPLFPVEQSDDYAKFTQWKNKLDQSEINNILNDNSDYLKTRLIKD